MQDINPGLQEDARSHFLNYLQLIWFRRRFVLITTVIVTALGALWLTQQPPVHVSTSSLRIGLTESQEAGGESSSARGAIDEIAGEVEVLKSRKLASVLITQFQLQLYPELNPAEDLSSGFPESTWHHVTGWFRGLGRSEDATTNQEMADSPVPPVVIDRFLKRLTVERVGQSRVVRITFASHDPNLAARVANALPEAYMAARQQARIQASSSEADFAAEQFIELQERLAASERAEAYYRGTLDNIEAASMDELEQQMSELNSRLLIVKARRDQALNRLALVETLTAGGDISEEDQEILASPRIERLLEQRALLNENVAGLAAGDPETAQTSDDIAAANAAIRSELDRLVIEIQDEAVAASEESIGLESQIAELTIASSSQHRRLLQHKEL